MERRRVIFGPRSYDGTDVTETMVSFLVETDEVDQILDRLLGLLASENQLEGADDGAAK